MEAAFFMFNFIRLRSPRGGMSLKSLMTWPVAREENTVIEKQIEHVLTPDSVYCLAIGYSVTDLSKGNKVYIKPHDAVELYKLLRLEFGDK